MPAKNKRLRIIAGPNGSGKSTMIDKLRQKFDCGIYINTDEIEKALTDKQFLNLNDYNIEANEDDFRNFLLNPNSQSLISIFCRRSWIKPII